VNEAPRAGQSRDVFQPGVSRSVKLLRAGALFYGHGMTVVANAHSSLPLWSAKTFHFQQTSPAFANKPQLTFLDPETLSFSVIPPLNQSFEIAQTFLHSVRKTWGIEN